MTPHRSAPMRRRTGAARQRGMVMFVALGVLIIMTLAGLAMLRQMGGSVSIAGNLAFKQSATAVADLGTEAARAWMRLPATVLTSDQTGAGYYSSWGTSVDPTTFAWGTAPSLTEPATGNTVRYVIHRLCQLPNALPDASGQRCSATRLGSPDHGSGGSSYSVSVPYYRITTQVTGPRNTVSYIQVVMN
jgi:type IV pilus assembly protein PilX